MVRAVGQLLCCAAGQLSVCLEPRMPSSWVLCSSRAPPLNGEVAQLSLTRPSPPPPPQIVKEAYPDPSQFDASAKYYDASAK